jgi:hypothetical protein
LEWSPVASVALSRWSKSLFLHPILAFKDALSCIAFVRHININPFTDAHKINRKKRQTLMLLEINQTLNPLM